MLSSRRVPRVKIPRTVIVNTVHPPRAGVSPCSHVRCSSHPKPSPRYPGRPIESTSSFSYDSHVDLKCGRLSRKKRGSPEAPPARFRRSLRYPFLRAAVACGCAPLAESCQQQPFPLNKIQRTPSPKTAALGTKRIARIKIAPREPWSCNPKNFFPTLV